MSDTGKTEQDKVAEDIDALVNALKEGGGTYETDDVKISEFSPSDLAPALVTYAEMFIDAWSEHQPARCFREVTPPEGESFMVAILQPEQLVLLVQSVLHHMPELLNVVMFKLMNGEDPNYDGSFNAYKLDETE